MKYIVMLSSFIVMVCVLFGTVARHSILLPMPAQVQHTHAAGRPGYTSAPRTRDQEQVTILVLDMSASMRENDPGNLRCSAADAYIDLSGPGDLIGVIGLDNNNNAREGFPLNLQQAMSWSTPTPMDTVQERQGLQRLIAERSHNCHYDGNTPTYDALNQALNMLTTSTQGGSISGSVILLTDGEPSPDQQLQETAILFGLLPIFKFHNWAIDTIALNASADTLGFLSGLADATSGKVYEDNDKLVRGVSPLNIMPYFVDIFARHHNRIIDRGLGPISLDNRGYARNFPVSNFTDELDVIVVKERPETVVTLTAPGPDGQVFPPATADAEVKINPYYAIFIIQGPHMGDWQLNVHGQGRFLTNSLTLSSLQVSLLSPNAQTHVLPLGQQFLISAMITYQGNLEGNLTVNAEVSYAGAPNKTSQPQDIQLSDEESSGTYLGQLIVPKTAPSGSYEITILARGATGSSIASTHRIIRLELFPMPFLVNQQNQATASAVSYTVGELDPALRGLFSVLLVGSRWWPLSNLVVPAPISLPCRIELDGKLYRQATVRAVVSAVGSTSSVPVMVVNKGNGYVQIILPPQTASGVYHVIFSTSGTFQDSNGDFGTTVGTIDLNRSVSLGDDLIVWLFLCLSALCIILAVVLPVHVIRFLQVSGPFGKCVESKRAEKVAEYNFRHAHYNRLGWLFWRHTLKSEQVYANESKKMPSGLEFRFRRGHRIEVRMRGKDGIHWKSRERQALDTKRFRKISELVFQPAGKGQDHDKITFLIDAKGIVKP